MHSKTTHGYFFEYEHNQIAYLTDTKGLPPATSEFLTKSKPSVLVIDCSFPPGSEKGGHNNLDEVLQIAKTIKPDRTILTHIGHDLDIWLKQNPSALPESIFIGRDGLSIYL